MAKKANWKTGWFFGPNPEPVKRDHDSYWYNDYNDYDEDIVGWYDGKKVFTAAYYTMENCCGVLQLTGWQIPGNEAQLKELFKHPDFFKYLVKQGKPMDAVIATVPSKLKKDKWLVEAMREGGWTESFAAKSKHGKYRIHMMQLILNERAKV